MDPLIAARLEDLDRAVGNLSRNTLHRETIDGQLWELRLRLERQSVQLEEFERRLTEFERGLTPDRAAEAVETPPPPVNLEANPVAGPFVTYSTPWMEWDGSQGWRHGYVPANEMGGSHWRWYACRQPIVERGGETGWQLRIHVSLTQHPEHPSWRNYVQRNLGPGWAEIADRVGSEMIWWWFEQRPDRRTEDG
jgi:hypothetical protein